MVFFFKCLCAKNARARLPTLQVPDSLLCGSCDNTAKLLLPGVGVLPHVLTNLPLLVPVLLLGVLTYDTSLLAVTRTQRFWLRLWTGSDAVDSLEVADSRTLKEFVYSSVLLETVPRVTLQAANSTLLSSWSDTAVVSTAVSSVSCFYSAVYFKFIKGVRPVEAPAYLSVAGVKLVQVDNIRGDDTRGSDIEGSGVVLEPSKSPT